MEFLVPFSCKDHTTLDWLSENKTITIESSRKEGNVDTKAALNLESKVLFQSIFHSQNIFLENTHENNYYCEKCIELTISLITHQIQNHCLNQRFVLEKVLQILENFQYKNIPFLLNNDEKWDFEIFTNILKVRKIKEEIVDINELPNDKLFVENLPQVVTETNSFRNDKLEEIVHDNKCKSFSNSLNIQLNSKIDDTSDTISINDNLFESIKDENEQNDKQMSINNDETKTHTPYKCNICGRTYQHKKSIARHKRMIHTASNNKLATIIIDGDLHAIKHIGNNAIVVECTMCNAYLCRKSIIKHMKTKHINAKPPWIVKSTYFKPDDIFHRYTCDYCNETFRSKIQIKRHFKSKHKSLFVRGRFPVYQCRDCDTFFTSLMAYRCHMKQYHPSKQLEKKTKQKEKNCLCDLCGQAFQSTLHLKNHTQLNHLNRRPYKCTLCNKDYPIETQLKDHMNSHTGDRPYICMFDSCGKTFKSKAARHSHHLTIHQNETVWKHQCEFCQKRFAMKSRLMIHRRTHTGEQPYQCHICGTKFKQGANWTRHLRKMHNIENAKRIK